MEVRSRLRARLFDALKIAVSVGMLAYVLLVRVDLHELAGVVAAARWVFLALGGDWLGEDDSETAKSYGFEETTKTN